MRKSRVLVVDDSASMRQLIAKVLNAAPDIEVVGQAADPLEARDAIKALNPDVVTLDVEMPNMNGLDFLEKLMRLRPTPVIMVSNHTRRGGDITVKALQIGAIDCITKPAPGDPELFAGLCDKVRLAAELRSRLSPSPDPKGSNSGRAQNENYRPNGKVVAIGSSTGGVEALTAVLAGFPANCAPVVITQHMPGTFTKSFAERLNRLCDATVTEAYDGAPLTPGKIYVAPGGAAHLEVVGSDALRCRLRTGDRVRLDGVAIALDIWGGRIPGMREGRLSGTLLYVLEGYLALAIGAAYVLFRREGKVWKLSKTYDANRPV